MTRSGRHGVDDMEWRTMSGEHRVEDKEWRTRIGGQGVDNKRSTTQGGWVNSELLVEVTTVPPVDQETADLEVSGGDSQADREELSHSITDLEAQVDTLRRAESLALEKVTTLEDELKNLKTLEEELTHDKAALQCRVDRQMTQMSALKAQLDAVKVTEAGDSSSSAVLPSMSPSLQHQLEQERDALTHSSKEAADLTEQLEQFREQLIERDEQLHQMEAQVVVSEKRCQHVSELEDKIQQLQVNVIKRVV
ncbi:hypothetical protein LSAT2_027480 [Lamellibrachia satsuma]|nr:hypothetical protein LSAT2_027480 [Lamellibrachia satsuma]